MTTQYAIVSLRKNASLEAVAKAVRKDTERARDLWLAECKENPRDANLIGGHTDRLSQKWHSLAMIEKHLARLANLEGA